MCSDPLVMKRFIFYIIVYNISYTFTTCMFFCRVLFVNRTHWSCLESETLTSQTASGTVDPGHSQLSAVPTRCTLSLWQNVRAKVDGSCARWERNAWIFGYRRPWQTHSSASVESKTRYETNAMISVLPSS